MIMNQSKTKGRSCDAKKKLNKLLSYYIYRVFINSNNNSNSNNIDNNHNNYDNDHNNDDNKHQRLIKGKAKYQILSHQSH